MSIFIFGSTHRGAHPGTDPPPEQCQDTDPLHWTGHWYFAKNKTSNTTFAYTKSSSEVSKELVDYVSFANEPVVAVEKKGRKGKWSRGRPRSNSSSSAPDAAGLPVVKAEGKEEPLDDGKTETETEEKREGGVGGGGGEDGIVTVKEEGEGGPQVDGETADKQFTETLADKIEQTSRDISAADSFTAGTSSKASSSAPVSSVIRIPPRHPLFGVWEGSFTLPTKTNNHGTRGERREVEVVEETFFFYAFEGENQEQQQQDSKKLGEEDSNISSSDSGRSVPGLEELPYPPRWTAAYIRELHSADRHDKQERQQSHSQEKNKEFSSATDQENQNQDQESRITAMVNASSGMESPTASSPVGDAPRAMKKEVSFDTDLVKLEQEGDILVPQGSEDTPAMISVTSAEAKISSPPTLLATSSSGSSSETLPGTQLSSSSSCPSALPSPSATIALNASAPRFSQQQATPNSSLLIPPADEIMLVGFGRNQYGRFSLAGAYNPHTGSLRCERKYMLTKPVAPVRHTPRLSGGGLDAENGSGLESGVSAKRPVRAKRAFSVDTVPADGGSDSNVPSTTSSGTGKRKRSASMWLLEGAGGGQEEGGGPHAQSDASAPLKRGRKKGQIYGSSKVGVALSQGQSQNQTYSMTSTAFLSALAAVAEKDGYRRAWLDPASGEVYEGEWRNGQRNGFGVALFPDGTLYEGWWLNNKEHGPAGLWMTGVREVLYSGEWAEGRMQGQGTYYFPSGDVYVGEFKEGARHGRGKYTRADGSSYEGDWKENLRHGKGVFLWTDGSEYSGDWEGGQRSGRGELLLSNGLHYSGTWTANFMEGRGVLRFPDGQEYKGIFKNGLREGRGSLVFPEGAIYEGRFREDALDGQGTLKITQSVPGAGDDEVYIPLDNLADIRRIHYKSGFGGDAHH